MLEKAGNISNNSLKIKAIARAGKITLSGIRPSFMSVMKITIRTDKTNQGYYNDYLNLILKDPFLPKDLLPKDWWGTKARELMKSDIRHLRSYYSNV